jgi:hypothetical protein
MHYDVFNGDADGICALQQLRLAKPIAESKKISGVKRDIQLLGKVQDTECCTFTVLDISLDTNRLALQRLLSRQNHIFYVDHHYAGDIPQTPLLTSHIDQDPGICTSLLVNMLLDGGYGGWAICGAFGDNLHGPARDLAASLSMTENQLLQLKEVGELLNYNSYGEDIEDLRFSPLQLCEILQHYTDPIEFSTAPEVIPTLRLGFQEDMEFALAQKEHGPKEKNRVYLLPDTSWARRISGVFANLKAREKTESAHALITENRDGSFRVSVRAPLADSRNADTLCRQFTSGGGRAGAAGINTLPAEMLGSFISAFHDMYR